MPHQSAIGVSEILPTIEDYTLAISRKLKIFLSSLWNKPFIYLL